jgi:hypothetical protein
MTEFSVPYMFRACVTLGFFLTVLLEYCTYSTGNQIVNQYCGVTRMSYTVRGNRAGDTGFRHFVEYNQKQYVDRCSLDIFPYFIVFSNRICSFPQQFNSTDVQRCKVFTVLYIHNVWQSQRFTAFGVSINDENVDGSVDLLCIE